MNYPLFISRKLLWSLCPFPLILTILLLSSNNTFIISWTILSFNSTIISLPFILDPWGTLFSSTVLFISANVIHFAVPYIKEDKFIPRFSILVLLFVLSINLLIFIPNLITLLLGWDGLGIVSFILVIYYQNPSSLAAGIITALINRIGDVIILLTIPLLLNLGQWSILYLWENPYIIFLRGLIIIAGITKSAQIPFSRWLPAAMAAPTPVSALVHSSTLVTAGVFLLFRFHYSLNTIPLYSQTLLVIASITIFIAGIAAIAECDIKKIIALSTLSQLGVMISRLRINLPNLAFFHLITHALFKALLFLTAGSIINFHHHSQDLRFMGNLSLSSPLTTSALLIANLALCGRPFLAGFYSKDLILEISLFNPTNIVIIVLFYIATLLTARYSIRFIITVIWNSSNSLPFQYQADSTTRFTTPILFLTRGTIIRGAILNWFRFNFLPEPILPHHIKLLPIIITFIGVYIAFVVTTKLDAFNIPAPLSFRFNRTIWFLYPLTSQGIIPLPLKTSHTILIIIDNGWLELLGRQGIFMTLTANNKNLILISKNPITTHLSITTIATLILFI